jgi:hypothetical protein
MAAANDGNQRMLTPGAHPTATPALTIAKLWLTITATYAYVSLAALAWR